MHPTLSTRNIQTYANFIFLWISNHFQEISLEKRTGTNSKKNLLSIKGSVKQESFLQAAKRLGLVVLMALFVFPRDNPQQNVLSLLTPGSDSVTIALSDGMIHFALHRVAYSTRIWLVETIPTSRLRALWGWPNVATERKRKGSIKKSNKNWDRNWWQRWHTIFFRATHQENKQCCVKHC